MSYVYIRLRNLIVNVFCCCNFCLPGDDVEEKKAPRKKVVHFIDGGQVEIRCSPSVVVVHVQNRYGM